MEHTVDTVTTNWGSPVRLAHVRDSTKATLDAMRVVTHSVLSLPGTQHIQHLANGIMLLAFFWHPAFGTLGLWQANMVHP